MPVANPLEIGRGAVDLVARGEPLDQVAKGLGISGHPVSRWVAIEAVDSGRVDGLTSAEERELIDLRRKTRTLEMENGNLKRDLA